MVVIYHIAGKFQFLWVVGLYHFAGLIFVDACTHTHYVQYN